MDFVGWSEFGVAIGAAGVTVWAAYVTKRSDVGSEDRGSRTGHARPRRGP